MILPQLQIARALAALSVAYYHSYMALRYFHDTAKVEVPFFHSWGYLGVNLFFAISGYIICVVLDKSNRSSSIFFIKRFFRIYPEYWLFILASIIFGQEFGYSYGTGDKSFLSLLMNFAIFPLQGEPIYAVGWSLEHEVVFYILAALIFPIGGRWLLFSVIVCLGFLGIFIRPSWDFHLFSSTHFDFASGILLYSMGAYFRRIGFYLPAGLSILIYAIPSWLNIMFMAQVAELLLLCAFINMPPNIAEQYMRPMIRLGDASYSLYLVHWLIIPIISSLAYQMAPLDLMVEMFRFFYLGVSVFLALCLRQVLEKPLIYLGSKNVHYANGNYGREPWSKDELNFKNFSSNLPLVSMLFISFLVVIFISINNYSRASSLSKQLPNVEHLINAVMHLPRQSKQHEKYDLNRLRAIKIDIPNEFIKDGSLSNPWGGGLAISKLNELSYLDLTGLPIETCRQLMIHLVDFPKVQRVAASGDAAKERVIPVESGQASVDCRGSTFFRIIVSE